MAAEESHNVQTTRALMRLVSEYRFDEAAELLHEDVIVDVPYPAFHQGPLRRGREQVAAGLAFVPMVFSSFVLTIEDLYDCPADDTVVFRQSSRGVFAAGGGEYRNAYLMVFGFRDGKLVLWREYFNPATMNQGMCFMLDFS